MVSVHLRRLARTAAVALAAVTLTLTFAQPAKAAPAGLPGIDVSHWQGAINWTSVRNAGIQWAYIKATESTTFKDSRFNTNYPNAYHAGVIRGAYHFARPNGDPVTDARAEANFFASNGGAWSADNRTLPGMLDLEGSCTLSRAATRTWIKSFYDTYKARTGRDVVIYTSRSWWNSCTGGTSQFAPLTPLFVASWTSASSPTMPSGFSVWTFWQYTDSGRVSGISGNVDRDVFNGSRDRLLALAKQHSVTQDQSSTSRARRRPATLLSVPPWSPMFTC